VLTLQEDEEQTESLLTRPSVFTRDENGDHYVIDSIQRRVAVFDRNGRYDLSFGSSGQGPGEFSYLMLQYLRDGVISIWDYANSRTTRYLTNGTLRDIIPEPLDFEYVPRGLWRTESGGMVVMRPFIVGSDSTSVTVAFYDDHGQATAMIESPRLLSSVQLMNPMLN